MKRSAPSAVRNRDPILAVLRDWLPSEGLVLEIASGTGEHAVHLAQAFPGLTIQPSDPDPDARASIDAWQGESALPNLKRALNLTTTDAWPVGRADAVLCINMVHISPWRATEGLIAGAASVLPRGGMLYLYGPYQRAGVATAESNEAFDQDLRRRNPEWGLRQLEDVVSLAAAEGLEHRATIEMPANNLSIVLIRT